MNVREKTGLEWPAPAEIEDGIFWAIADAEKERPNAFPVDAMRVVRKGINAAIKRHLEDKK